MSNSNKKNIWHFFVENRRFAIVMVLLSCLIGLFSIYSLPKESSPEIDIPIAMVTTIYAGAGAEDVEELVTDVLENKIVSMSGVDKVTSSSKKGVSVIMVQFDVDADGKEKVADLKNEIDKVKKDLPDDVQEPSVIKADFNNSPIMIYSLSGQYDLPNLKSMAEDIKKELEGVSGVSKVEISGGQDREIKVVVDKSELDKFQLSLSQVTSAIGQSNTDIPIGSIETGDEKYTLRFEGRINNAEQIKNIPVGVSGSIPVFVKDIATVIDGFQDATTLSYFGKGGEESYPAISLNIYRASGGEILEISDEVGKRMEKVKASLPENVSIDVVDNDGESIATDLGGLLRTGAETILIVSLAVLFFVGWREALLSAISIPLSYFLTFFVLDRIGYTLNFLTLFSLILALGIMVDAAIVVSDAMNKEIKSGKSSKEAALKTIDEFKSPLIFGTLTTVFAFVPMLLASGIMGKFIRTIPVTVTIILLSSILIAVMVLPALAVKWINIGRKAGEHEKPEPRYFVFAKEKYEFLIRKLFSDNKLANTFLFGVILLFFFALALPATGLLKSTLFPSSDTDKIYINIEELPGTMLDKTSAVTKKVEENLMNYSDIKSLQLNIGSPVSTSASSSSGKSENRANIIINLKKDRKKPSYEFVKDLRTDLGRKDFGTAKVEVVELGYGPSSGSPVQINITGTDLTKLEEISNEYESILKGIKGVSNVDTSIEETNGEFVIEVDRAKAQTYGLSAIQIASVLRNAVNGTTGTVIRENGNDTDVVVKSNIGGDIENTNKTTLDMINSLTIETAKGDIPLSTFTNSYLHG
ncbi:MAG: efflux RND transporter permease subunit, partial [Candidatus Pacebacteria bacterium]|nr:efflux RND transporter permease subunit [Candidatus Paceibacterota bacterium]